MLPILRAAWRVVVLRSLADWVIVAAAWLVIVLAVTLLAAGVMYADAVASSGLHRLLADAPVDRANVELSLGVPANEVDGVDPVVGDEVRRALATTGGGAVRVARSGSFALPGQPADDVRDLALLGHAEEIERHATVTAGSWPTAGSYPVEAALSAPAAELLELGAGDEVELAARGGAELSVTVRVAGIYRVDDRTDPYWFDEPLVLDGIVEGESFDTYGPFLVPLDDLAGRLGERRVDLSWRLLPDFARLETDELGALRAAVEQLPRRVDRALGGNAFPNMSTELPALLAAAERSLLVSRSGVLLLTIQLGVLAAYALLLVAGLLIEQRRLETALLRARGAGAGHLGAMALMEGLLLVGSAVVAGPLLAVLVLRVFGAVGPLATIGLELEPRIGQLALLISAAAAAAGLLALVVPVLLAATPLASVRRRLARPARRPAMQRAGFDLALFAIAAIGLWQLRVYGAPITRTLRGSLGVDPLLVAAPAIGLLAGALLALRIVPLAAQGIEAALTRRRGLVPALGARQLARRPLRYTRAALLLMLAAALGIFAAAYGGTWLQSQRDQADYQVGADLRVAPRTGATIPLSALSSAYRRVAGVDAAMAVARERFDVAGHAGGGQLLALDAAAAPELVRFRSDLAGLPLQSLVHELSGRRPSVALVALPGRPQRLAVDVNASLTALIDARHQIPLPAGWRGIGLTVVVRDADGLIHRYTAPQLTADGGAQRAVVSLTSALPDGALLRPAYPIELVGVEIGVRLPADAAATGELALTGVSVAQESNGGAWEPVPLGGRSQPWRWLRADLGTAPSSLPGSPAVDAPLAFSPDDALLTPDPVTFLARPAGLADLLAALPGIASERFLSETGVRVGERVTIGSGSERRAVEVVGSLRAFPTLSPDRAVMLVDLPTLALVEYASEGELTFADEWWLAAERGALDEIIRTVRNEPFATEAASAADLRAEELVNDPVALGIIGALSLGAVAAALFAGIGFVVSATVAARERLTEFALLRALGLSPAQLARWLSLENTFLLAVGLLAGTALGLAIGWVVLPFATLSQQATTVVPEVQVVVPWQTVLLVDAIAIAALLITVAVLAFLLRRFGLTGALRVGED